MNHLFHSHSLFQLSVLTFLVICGGVAACSPSRPTVTYRIPPDKQDAAAKLVAQLAGTVDWRDDPRERDEAAWNTALKVYGEPVVVKP